MVANAHKEPGEDGMKVFNIGYLAGISGLLFAWNAAIVGKVLTSDDYIPVTARCLNKQPLSNSYYPIAIVFPVFFLCNVFSLIITTFQ